MDINDPVGIGIYQHFGNHHQAAGQNHQIRLTGLQLFQKRPIKFFPVRIILR